MISILLFIPVVESASVIDNFLDAITGFFHLITGEASLPSDCEYTCAEECVSGEEAVSDQFCGSPDLYCCRTLNICGDGFIDDEEDCEGGVDGVICSDLGFAGGDLACSSCQYNTDDCYSSFCGDGNCDADETCAGCLADCDGEQAECADDMICKFGECVGVEIPDICGDGVVNGFEECDGSDLNGASCTSLGYDAGALACGDDCTFDTSDCEYDAVTNPSTATTTTTDEEDDPTTCTMVGGSCTNACDASEIVLDASNLEEDCMEEHGSSEPLLCCVPSDDYQSAVDTIDQKKSSTSTHTQDVTDLLEGDEIIKKDYSPEDQTSIQKLFSNPSYALAGLWVWFILAIAAILISYFVHNKLVKKTKKRRRKN